MKNMYLILLIDNDLLMLLTKIELKKLKTEG